MRPDNEGVLAASVAGTGTASGAGKTPAPLEGGRLGHVVRARNEPVAGHGTRSRGGLEAGDGYGPNASQLSRADHTWCVECWRGSDGLKPLLQRLAPDQRAAATAPPGPVLCVAPAGSGKTTTLVARIAWLVDMGTDPATICAITFNRRAAEELVARLDQTLAAQGLAPGAVRVRTFHALGREILLGSGHTVEPLVDRHALLGETGVQDAVTRRALDDAFSRLKLDLGVAAGDVATDPDPGPIARAFLRYEAALAARGGLDFDDLVASAVRALSANTPLLDTWRARCRTLLVDEVQDVDRTQLRLALLLAAPGNDIFLVGDDDQTIYGWRLADVRRVLGLAAELPGLRRIDLVTNYRCPGPVVERAVRLVSCNRERFAKEIRARPGARGRLVLAPDASDDVVRIRRVLERWPEDGSTRAILARTNRELVPAIVAAVQANQPFRAPEIPVPIESPAVDAVLEAAAQAQDDGRPLALRLADAAVTLPGEELRRPQVAHAGEGGAGRTGDEERWAPSVQESLLPAEATLGPASAPGGTAMETDREASDAAPSSADLEAVRSLLAWAPGHRTLECLRDAVLEHRARLARLRSDTAALTIATVHGTKGLEWDHVAVIGLEADRFPSARSVREAEDPERTLEEERRLAYVAWTRARHSLTLLYDPGAPSQFLLEAFTPEELGLPAR